MLKTIFSFIFLLLIIKEGFAFQKGDKSTDTLGLTDRISNRMHKFKRQNKIQIHKFYSPDSTIVFGSNKQQNFLTSVFVIDRVHSENRWFFYDSSGIFRISIIENHRTENSNKRKKGSCTYYFENGIPVRKTEDGATRAPVELLVEAQHYQELASPYFRKN